MDKLLKFCNEYMNANEYAKAFLHLLVLQKRELDSQMENL